MSLNVSLIQNTISAITDFPAVSHATYRTQTFVLSELLRLPNTSIKSKNVLQILEPYYPAHEDVLYLNTSVVSSSVLRLSFKGTTLLGNYEISLEQDLPANEFGTPVTVKITLDEAMASLMPKSNTEAGELVYSFLACPDTWINETGFAPLVEKETRVLRWTIRAISMGSFAVLGMLAASILTNNQHWFF